MVCFDKFLTISVSLLAVIAVGCGGDGGIAVQGVDGGDLGPMVDQVTQADTRGTDGVHSEIPLDGVPVDGDGGGHDGGDYCGDDSGDETLLVKDDAAETAEDVDVTVDVLANDTSLAGGSLSVAAFDQPLYGKAELLPDDKIRYSPPRYFSGTDEFEYTASTELGKTAVALVTVTISPVGADFYVALDGGDSKPGTLEQPFATLEKARQAVVDLKAGAGLPVGGVNVWLRGGTFQRTEAFDLGPDDSGTQDKPIRYIGFPKEQARLVGGQLLTPGSFSETTSDSPMWDRLHDSAKGNVWQVDIAAQGVVDYKMTAGGLTDDRIGGTEVFLDGDRLQIARWPDPDEAEWGFVRVDQKISDKQFTYLGDRPESWEPAEDMMLHGYFAHYWCDYRARVIDFDTATKTVNLMHPPYFGIKANRFYFAYNIFEEITQPGEWYLDRDLGILYLWPPGDLDSSEVVVTTPIGSDGPISEWDFIPDPILRLVNAQWISFHDLTIEIAMNHLVEIEGGSNNSLVGCGLLGAGGTAVQVSGHDNGLERCEVGHAGNSGVRMSGGDRKSITLSNNYVRNCDIHHTAVSARTGHAGVWLDGGAGHIVEHNWFHHSPSNAIYLLGNEHLVQYNHIHDVCQWADDYGAVYTHLNWGFRGNRIQYNFIHDLASPFNEETHFGITAVYLDGFVGGISVFGNIIKDIQGNGVLIGGGPDNVVENNIIVNTTRGMYSHNLGVTGIKNDGGNHDMLNKINAMDYQQEPWLSAYPALAAVPNNWNVLNSPPYLWLYPHDSVFSRNLGFEINVFTSSNDFGNPPGTMTTFDSFAEIADNIADADPLFSDEAGGEFSLLPNSPAFDIPGFVEIPFEQIGIQAEEE